MINNIQQSKTDKISAVFLDRDGVINKKIEGDYVKKWEEFEFLPDVMDAVKLLNTRKIPVYIITNQSGIGRGHMSHKDLKIIHDNMIDEFKKQSVYVDDIFFCPHAPGENCNCRKPKPGLLIAAKQKYPTINFGASWLIGDSQSDIEAGKSVGCKTYLLQKNKGLKEIIENILELGGP